MTLAAALSFVVGLLGVLACWLMLGQPRRHVRWLAVSQAALMTWPALRELPHVEWMLTVLVVVPLVVEPRPHIALGRFCVSIMAGMLCAGIVAAV